MSYIYLERYLYIPLLAVSVPLMLQFKSSSILILSHYTIGNNTQKDATKQKIVLEQRLAKTIIKKFRHVDAINGIWLENDCSCGRVGGF
jgi:hypothetical protein